MINRFKFFLTISLVLFIHFFSILPAEANWVQVSPGSYTMSGGIGYITGNYVSLSGYKDQPYSGITMTFSNGANTYVWPWFDNSPLLGSFGSGGTVTPGSNYYLTATGPVYGFAGPFTVGDSELPQSPSVTCSGATNTLTVTLYLGATDNIGVTAYYAVESPTAPAAPSGTGGGWTAVTPSTNYAGSHSFIATKNAGSKTVHVWFKDGANNVSTRASATFTITDTAAPAGSFMISQPAGSVTGFFNSANIGVSLTASDVVSDTTHFYIRNDNSSQPAAGDSNWRTFSASPPGQSASQSVTYSLTGVDGAKNVYVWYKDAAGNIGAASDSPQNLTLDTKAPIAGREGNGVWEIIGNQGLSSGAALYNNIFVYEETPFIAFQDQANSHKASVMKFDGTNWVYVGTPGFSANNAKFISLFVYSGIPYVAYCDNAYGMKTSVMKFNGTNWVYVGTPGFSDVANYTSLFISNGTPFLAFQDYNNGQKISVKKFDGTNWINVGAPGFSAGNSGFTSLYIENGIPYVAYEDYANGQKSSVMTFNGSAWTTVGIPGFSDGMAQPVSLSVQNGIPYIAFLDGTRSFKTTVMKFNGTNWVNVGNPGFSDSPSTYSTSLFIFNETPYVIFEDFNFNSKASVMKFNGTNWVYVGGRGFSTGQAQTTDLFIHNGILYTAFSNNDNFGKIESMKYSETINDGFIINNGAKLTTVRTLKMQIFGTDWRGAIAGTGIEKYSIRYNNSTAPASGDSAAWFNMPAGFDNATPATKEVNFTLPAAELDGLKIFYLWFKDKAGNTSSAAQKSIKLDTHPPVEPIAGSIAIAGAHPELQVTREVMLLLNAESGQDGTEGYYDIKVTHYLIKDNNLGASVSAPTAASTGWIAVSTPVTPYSDTVPYTITSSGDGTKEIRAWYKDIAGNMSDSSECETYLDTSIPHGSFTINGGVEWSNSPLVTLNLNAISATAVSGYFISTNSSTPATSDARWRPVSPPTANYIADIPYSLDRSAGIKTIYVWYKSTSGIVSAVSSDTIKLDCEAPSNGTVIQNEWLYLGSRKFTPSTATDTSLFVFDDTPYITFLDFTQGSKLSVMKYNGTDWQYVGSPGITSNYASNKNAMFVYEGTPYIVYRDFGNSDKATVKKFDGTNWVIVGNQGFSNEAAHNPTIYIHKGTPYVAFSQTGALKASVMKFNGTAWVYVGTPKFHPDARHISLAFHNNEPYIAFQDYDGTPLGASVMKFNGAAWEYIGNRKFSSGDAWYINLLFNNGVPFVSFCDMSLGSGYMASVMKFNGSGWDYVGNRGFSSDWANNLSFAIHGGTPFVAYRDRANGSKASVMKFDGASWPYVGKPGFSNDTASHQSIAFLGGSPITSFSDGSGKASVMKHHYKRGPGLDINNGDPYTNSNSIKLNLAGSDNYSGITEYCVSESPAPPNASTTWNLITFPAGGTTEVSYSLSTVTKPVTVYVWYRDAAGNISSYSSAIANPRSMKAVESYGNSSTFNKPFLIAKDSEENLLVADKPAAGISPVFILSKSASPSYSTGTRIIPAGAGINQLKEVVSGLVVFSGNFIGLIENAKKRFAVFKAYSIFVNGFAKSVDIIANYHGAGAGPINDARALVGDKYTGGLNPVAEARIMANQTPSIPLDFNFAAAAIEIFTDAAYSTPVGQAVSSKETLYIRVRGSGGDPNAVNSIMMKAKSSGDPKGIAIQLIETSTSNDIFTGTLTLGQHTDLAAGALGAGPATMIYLGVYSKIGILNRAVRTKPKPPSGPTFIANLGGGAGGSIFIEMVRITAGKFVMGQSGITDATPTHEVTISKDFYMSKYEITQGQWLKVMGALASADKPLVSQSNTYNYGKGENYPVYYVSCNDICDSGGNDFLTRLNAMGLVDGTFRLPTEAEWEYACRAGTTSTYYWGEDASEATVKNYCWYDKNASSSQWTVPHAAVQGAQIVGQKLPNAFGLYDMSGNVYEWCSDWYGAYSSAAVTDPVGPATGSLRVLRGGNWYFVAAYCRQASRLSNGPSNRGYGIGFRLVLPAGQ